MKKFTLFIMCLLACAFQVNAQQFVSTTPANRNVILEEFTGRSCGYCPDGHRIANEIMAQHPGHVWAINIHTGGFAPTSYPNMNTTDGAAIASGFSISGYPSGVVNRTTSSAIDRGQWASTTNTQLNQASEVNVAGQVVVNPATRLATITVEAYYTGNSAETTNYLTVAMLQDSILGSQSDYGNYNPTQWLNGQYVHMHILRDVVTPTWGEAITPTTTGTLVTKTYTYTIPENIGSPNGVDVDLDNIFFLAWVTEKYQGTPTRPVMSACELEYVQGTEEPIYPFIANVAQADGVSCQHSKTVNMHVTNGGLDELTEIKFQAVCEGQTYDYVWEGHLASYSSMDVDMDIDVPFGSHTATFNIVEANGEPFEFSKTATVTCDEWSEVQVDGESEELELEIVQDKFGNQITWKVFASDMTVLASGGPYNMLLGGNSTQTHIEHCTVPANECVMFAIYDNVGNGICCDYGEGYYRILDSNGNVIVDGNGAFGSEAHNVLSMVGETVSVSTTEVTNISYNEATFIGSVDGNVESVGFEYRKVTSPETTTVPATLTGKVFTATVTDLDASSIYMVKAFAVANGQTYYGNDITFNTWTLGVENFENSLKLYPNPASSKLNIEGNNIASVDVYNTIGQLVVSQEVSGNHVQISTSGMSEGIYFIRIHGENGNTVTKRFSVSR